MQLLHVQGWQLDGVAKLKCDFSASAPPTCSAPSCAAMQAMGDMRCVGLRSRSSSGTLCSFRKALNSVASASGLPSPGCCWVAAGGSTRRRRRQRTWGDAADADREVLEWYRQLHGGV